ncbi:hypothetical protein G3570_01405 [Balneolaceae bacterium YR4-1]|uniref:Uncharacterized protein n=1 Tax=Halalkalibaculum roseum TaxID=2709311 RepID=A0A6M1SW97_9BACT|nr:hypothetical protein [Halalkalibaculum roseum]NGP75274.1 hypothetical protein [Halalkalibaculum roseum]
MKNYLKPNLKIQLLSCLIFSALMLAGGSVHAQNAYQLKKDHFYKTFKKKLPGEESRVLHFPVMLDEKMRTEFFYEGREEIFEPLRDSLNIFLDRLEWTTASGASVAHKGAPYLFVGSSEAETAPPATMMMRNEEDIYPPMALYLEKPSKQWRNSMRQLMADNGSDYALLLWVGLTEYPKTNKGVFKKKVVLGTDYEHEIRFLSAVDKPVEVLQLTGILLDRDGEVVRAGAEGFLHEDSPFWLQVLNAGSTIDDKSIRTLFTEQVREDLPGHPPAWKVAAINLLEQLTQRSRYQ